MLRRIWNNTGASELPLYSLILEVEAVNRACSSPIKKFAVREFGDDAANRRHRRLDATSHSLPGWTLRCNYLCGTCIHDVWVGRVFLLLRIVHNSLTLPTLCYNLVVAAVKYTYDTSSRARWRRQRWQRALAGVVHSIVADHTHGVMIGDLVLVSLQPRMQGIAETHMADDLPKANTSCVHVKRLSFAVVDRDSVVVCLEVFHTVAVHVEDVRCRPVSVDVPDDLVIGTHFECWVVGEDCRRSAS